MPKAEEEAEDKPAVDQIPTILHDRSLIAQLKSLATNKKRDEDYEDPLLSLFSVDDITALLSQPNMRHGDDYKLVKKIILPPTHPQAGEEYNGMLPNPDYSIEEVYSHFNFGAFSLVVNKMQQRWGAVADVARRLEEELGVMQVNANLYATPDVPSDGAVGDNVRQGFEAHWDWMDGESLLFSVEIV